MRTGTPERDRVRDLLDDLRRLNNGSVVDALDHALDDLIDAERADAEQRQDEERG